MGVRSSKRLAKVPQAANRWARSYMSPAFLPLVPSDWVEPDYLDPIDYALNADYVLPLGCYLFRVVLLSSSSCTSGPSMVVMMNSVASLSDISRAWWGFSIQAMICVHGAIISLAGRSKGSSQSGFRTGKKRWVWVAGG